MTLHTNKRYYYYSYISTTMEYCDVQASDLETQELMEDMLVDESEKEELRFEQSCHIVTFQLFKHIMYFEQERAC